jgi:transcription initiation factor TFIID TATA-box-binding protein
MPKIVNVVGSGKLGVELDVRAVAEDIDAAVVKLSDTSYSNRVVYIREREGGPMATLFRSGSYHITGGSSIEETAALKDWMGERLHALGIDATATFDIKNVVVVGDLEQDINLNQLVVWLGLEKTEYEPEQFPGVIYHPPDVPCVFLIFGSGRVVVTGATSAEIAFDGFEELKGELEELS